MPIDRATVDHVAFLARLSLTDEERTMFTMQLQHILNYFDRLQQLDLAAVEPASHILAELDLAVVELASHIPAKANSFRDDVVRPPLAREEVLAAAPAQEDGFFKVPPVLEPI